MYSFSEELFLSDFFTFDAVVGRFCDGWELMHCLAWIYYIDDERVEQLFALATSPEVRNIVSVKDYERYRRLHQYAEACGRLKADGADAADALLTVKGKALRAVNAAGLTDAAGNTKACVYANIADKANAGHVMALRICGVLQCTGIFFDRHLPSGLKNLTRAARWNSVESILALLQFDVANSPAYVDMLYSLTAGTPYEDLSRTVQKRCGIETPRKMRECLLLSRAFGHGQIKPDIYLPVLANLLYSEILSFKDKEKLLLSDVREYIASLTDLPLKLSRQRLSCDFSAISGLSIQREAEQDAIIRNALNSDIRHFESFKPLCLCSDSEFMRHYYMAAIAGLYRDAHIEVIPVAELNAHDLEPSARNVFVRSCNENTANILILSFVGDIREDIFNEACSFLQSARRGRMRLMQPRIELDLGAVLPICFCDRNNAPMLSRWCDRVELAAPEPEEQAVLLRELIAAKERQYGLGGLTVDDAVMNKLLSVSIDAAEAALDLAITANRHGDRGLALTAENAGKYIRKRETSRGFGYGGACNDDH